MSRGEETQDQRLKTQDAGQNMGWEFREVNCVRRPDPSAALRSAQDDS